MGGIVGAFYTTSTTFHNSCGHALLLPCGLTEFFPSMWVGFPGSQNGLILAALLEFHQNIGI